MEYDELEKRVREACKAAALQNDEYAQKEYLKQCAVMAGDLLGTLGLMWYVMIMFTRH